MGTAVTDVSKSVFADGPSTSPYQVDKPRVRQEVGPVIDARVDEALAAATAASAGLVRMATWTALSAVTGTRVGQPAEVPATDAGTHTDPVVGGTKANAGQYRWSVSPAGWHWVAVLSPPFVAATDAEAIAKTAIDRGLTPANAFALMQDWRVQALNTESGFIYAVMDANDQILFAVDNDGRLLAHLSEYTVFPDALMTEITAGTSSISSIACWGDSLTASAGGGGTTYPWVLASALGRSVYQGGVGGQTSSQILTRILADTSHRDWTTVFWIGRNNYAAAQTVVNDILDGIDHLTPSTSRFIVLSVPNGDYSRSQGDFLDEWQGGDEYDEIIALNDELGKTFGPAYVDVRRYLIDYGLRDAGVTPTAQDLIDIGHDVVPLSLRSDKIHLNSAGYTVVGNYVARLLRARHW
jgi:lysophospholipase L1-like esterase